MKHSNLKTKIVLLVFTSLVFACKKSYDKSQSLYVNSKLMFDINSKDDNSDLLNPITKNHLTIDSLNMLYRTDTGFLNINYTNLDNPKNISIYKKGDLYIMQVSVSPYIINNDSISTTVLKLGNKQIDTIFTRLKIEMGSLTISKAWHNNGNLSISETNRIDY